MQYFWEWAVRPLFRYRGVSRVLEIGASQGGNTDRIIDTFPEAAITIIDPCFDTCLVTKYQANAKITVLKGRSLEILPDLSGQFDAILMDGDHNYHTVINELRVISKRCLVAPGGMILFHDVGKPWAYEDLYYEPEQIPEAAKAPGAPHGVLTAINEFLSESPKRWIWLRWRAEHGLGCLADPRFKSEHLLLRLNTWLWRGIRWRSRFLRLVGIKRHESIVWGRSGKQVLQESAAPMKKPEGPC